MREIIVGFSKPKGWFKPYSWLIRAIEGTSYSHTYIKTYARSADTWLVYQASGVQVNFIGEKRFYAAVQVVKEFNLTISEDSYGKFLNFAIRESGAPYGIKGVLGNPLARVFNLKKNPFGDGSTSYYCVELVARVLKDGLGVVVSDDELEKIGLKELYELLEKQGA